nr:translation initiation factor IF-2 [Streptococcus marmotae]
MSKKRLYEIAKELGKESKEVVAKAKELGIEVKSHSSSVEAEVAQRIVDGFSGVKKTVEKVAETVKKAPAQEAKPETAPKRTEQVVEEVSKEAKPAAPQAPSNRPKSRNFKAEREARAKEQAARRNQGKNQGRQQEQGAKGQQKPHRDRKEQDRRNKGQSFDKRSAQASQRPNRSEQRPKVEEPRAKIDFKARAAALKAEQLQEYARTSEERFRQAQEAKKQPQKPKEIKFEEPVIEPKPKKVAPPVIEELPAADKRRKKQTRPEKRRDDFDHEEEGPRKQQKNRNSQNQVRNQRNSNWNPNKKNKKGKQQTVVKPATERKFHELPTEFEYTSGMTVAEIAKRIKREPAEIVKKLFMMGVMATQNQSLDGDTIELLMVDYGIEAKEKIEVDNADIERFFVEEGYLNEEAMVERPPVVTIMGHVDHGKTTLLDTLRNSRVATGEAGGITQHIGAYQIEEGGRKITFLDTPGHAAFTSMRARGASVTDLTILVVAADDGVMPQTIEAINHSKAANVPIIVAINKIDKPGANPERVIGELAEHGVISTAWGGDCEFVEISAKFNQNIDELLETVLLVAEIQELKADPTVRAIGTVIEAHLDKGKGAVATLLVQQGTLNVQDPIVVGNTFGRVRAMTNDLGRRVKVAGPSTPVSITGLNEAPMAGDHFAVYEDEKSARAAGEERAKRALLKQRQITQRVSLENLFDTLKAGEVKSVNVIIKADVQGSVEALASSLQKIEVEGVRVNIVHSAVGAINESDVTLAEASNAFIIGFSVRPTPQARQQAESDDVEIRLHSIIYKVIEEMEDAMKGMLDPEYQEKIIGEALVRETFKVSKVGTIGGFMVISGKVTRDSSVRVIRDGVVVFDGKLASLKHFKDDVKEITNGREGGLMIDNYNDLKVDDVIEAYIMEEIKK